MMLASRRPSHAALVFAWCGAALFALSLLFFLYSYLIRFRHSSLDGNAAEAIAIDIALFTIFALHHSVLARDSIKARVRRLVHPAVERSIYTWTASILFLMVCALWRFVPGDLYRLTGAAAIAGYAVQLAGSFLATRSAARLDVLDLAGVRGVLDARQGAEPGHVALETSGVYSFVRHPVYLGWILLVFATPQMTMTRFVFAVISTLYLAVAVPFEERSLVKAFGSDYRAYQTRVRWRILPGLY
jgi:protein-S-isoprenylcysteine O-methyltransferase Ste14